MDVRRFVISFISIVLLLFWGCKEQKEGAIIIAVAANMQFAMQEISEAFTKNTGVRCKLVISSSGKLTAQIQEGAPFDIFVAANLAYPTEVYKKDRAVYPPKIYAYGQLVLWSAIDTINPSIKILTNKNIRHIALANPRTAPYGEATINVLQYYSIYQKLEDKLVYGESIAQTNQFIVSKSSKIGFTAKSVVMSPKMKEVGHWRAIDRNIYPPIHQAVVMLKDKNTYKEDAHRFYDFLFSSEAKEILEDFGYLTPNVK